MILNGPTRIPITGQNLRKTGETMATRDKSGKCRSGKHKYKSFTEAMIGATTRRVETEGRYYPNAYRCKFCKRYHMTKGKKIES